VIANLSLGKLRRLGKCSTASGRFLILANDHRNNLRRALSPDAPDSIGYAELAAFKRQIVESLSPSASAVLLDPEFGVAESLASGALASGAGLIVSIEETGYSGSETGRTSRVLPGWSVEKAARVGADAIKLLVYYHPDAGNARAQEELIGQVVAECQHHDLPLFLEPLSYALNATDGKLSSAEKCRIVVETAARLTPLGIDILKAEFPLDSNTDPDEENWSAACQELSAASCVPWVLLSANVSFELFVRQTRVACAAGASGILAGRAIWAEATSLPGQERETFLTAVAHARLRMLSDVVELEATAWPQSVQIAPPEEGWFVGY
jgi:tagatose 1,6-diphosphate aldolase